MLSGYLIGFVEQHADVIAEEFLADLLNNKDTTSFRRLSQDELRQNCFAVYHGLGGWLADTDEPSVETKFEQIGRQRFHEQVPLSEEVWAIALMKQHLREKIRSVGVVYSVLELHNELHLSLLIGRFFDRMVYAVVRGYELATEEAAQPPRTPQPPKSLLGESPVTVGWLP